ncbi:Uncharacterised protein [Mycobacterium tuberculosis]|uniref:Uncharacterized protein n=2 Tax=Mycobacterium tuberculosis TaxID=1773 RepID=A0A654U2P4_MYCTX|nr:Uncharacterised protein [Mycobacterium tuberculosis]
MRSHVDQGDLAGFAPPQQLRTGDRILRRTEHVCGRDRHVGQMLVGNHLHQREQPCHVFPSNPVVLPGPLAASLDQPAALQRLQIRRCRGQVHPGRRRDRFYRALTLGEQVQDLQSPPIGQRLAHARYLVQQRRLTIGLSSHFQSSLGI